MEELKAIPKHCDDILLQEIQSLKEQLKILAHITYTYNPDVDLSKYLHNLGTEDYQLFIENNKKEKAEWISVDDRLPKETHETLKYHRRRKFFIVCNSDGIVFVADWQKESYNKEIRDYFRLAAYPRKLKNITHWIPLPEPPKAIT